MCEKQGDGLEVAVAARSWEAVWELLALHCNSRSVSTECSTGSKQQVQRRTAEVVHEAEGLLAVGLPVVVPLYAAAT